MARVPRELWEFSVLGLLGLGGRKLLFWDAPGVPGSCLRQGPATADDPRGFRLEDPAGARKNFKRLNAFSLPRHQL